MTRASRADYATGLPTLVPLLICAIPAVVGSLPWLVWRLVDHIRAGDDALDVFGDDE